MFGEVDSTLEPNRLDAVHHPCALSATEPQPGPVRSDLHAAMLAAIPSLRAFAMSLTHNLDAAEDLVQDTILRAWTKIDYFEPGTCLNAWLFTILRNSFRGQWRKAQREVADPDGSYAGRLRTPPEQHGTCAVQDMLRALGKVRVEHRVSLLLECCSIRLKHKRGPRSQQP
jgi:RNA polymerase sigma-70 factor, ECF subfamily